MKNHLKAISLCCLLGFCICPAQSQSTPNRVSNPVRGSVRTRGEAVRRRGEVPVLISQALSLFSQAAIIRDETLRR
ncbi:hypothetical protein Barb6XT_02081 [Bacteroidales bacterium Barb6XT]|nr:hypothetical protein Barb6XT_02081 [Bacteroidales bacterium Barb6XT]